MDIFRRIFQQFFELFRAMSPSQRGTLIAVPLLVIGGFAVLLWSNRGGSETALSFGKVYTTEEVIAVEQALVQANLNDWRRVGGRIMVPAGQVDRYNAALVEFDAVPTDLGSQMMTQLKSMGPFSTEAQRQDMKKGMLLQAIRRMIKAVPDIEDAEVVVADSARRATWGSKTRVTATVQVKPRGGRELSPKLAHTLRSAVASMVPDLLPENVTVWDRIHHVSYTGDAADDPLDSKLMQRVRELTHHFEQQIRDNLDYIPNVGVNVHVDIDNLKSSITRSQVVDPKKTAPIVETRKEVTDKLRQAPLQAEAGVKVNQPQSLGAERGIDRTRDQRDEATSSISGVSFEVTEKALFAAMPNAVRVSVSIPYDYYRDVATQNKANGSDQTDIATIETSVKADVEKSVSQLIPKGAPAAVTVTSVNRLPNTQPEPTIPWTERGLQWGREWGGSIALGLFALWVLRALRRMAPPTVAAAPEPGGEADPLDVKRPRMPGAPAADEFHADRPNEPTRRDLIQSVVKDNPEMTAAVIGKWLQQANK